jgi:hypothetical protein
MRNLNMPAALCLISVMAVTNVGAEGTAEQSAAIESGAFGGYQPKGFLSDYSKLKSEGDDSEAFIYIDSAVDFGKYRKLLIDRIKIWFKDDADYKGIDPTDLKALTDYFHHAIVKAVEDKHPVVTEPGPDVLRLRIAVTDLVPNKPSASVVSLAVPFLWVADAGTGVAKGETGSTAFSGEATVEFEALDSVSTRQVAAYIETRAGKKYNWTHGVEEGVSSYLKAYSTWDYTKQAMDYWAQLLRKRLDGIAETTAASP